LSSGAQGVIDGYGFLTTKYLISIDSVTGFLANNVGTISCQVPQYNSGQNIAGTYLTISGASSGSLTMSDIDSRPESNESLLDVAANYGGQVSITGGIHRLAMGSFFKAGSRDQTDPSIDVNNVSNVQSSANIAFANLDNNALSTTINVLGTAVKINATTWADVVSSRFSLNTDGTWTYNGIEPINVSGTLIVSVDAAGGGTKTMSAYLAKNGVFIADSRGKSAGSSDTQIVSSDIIPIVTGDTIEAYIANDSDTVNLTITTASFRLTGF
jgi:hypothetical protein